MRWDALNELIHALEDLGSAGSKLNFPLDMPLLSPE